MVKIVRLTPSNIQALEGLESKRPDVALSNTTAEFNMTPEQALRVVEQYQSDLGAKHGSVGHPYQSLHAVIRKLRAEVPRS